MDTPNLGLPFLMAAQAQKHVTHNEALRALDALVHLAVIDRDATTPPVSPADGDRYIVAAGGAGAWEGRDYEIAAYQDGAWAFFAPLVGWRSWVGDEEVLVVWDGGAWSPVGGSDIGGDGDFDTVGINAAADTTNRLAIAAPASLFNHAGNGHQQKINKAAAGDTASQLYQTGFSGRAEIGLTGDDDFHLKVSPDGGAWHDAILIDKDTGEVSFPSGVDIDNAGVPAGGTTGQVLAKASNDDGDVAWSTPGGAGDMLASLYDPQDIGADAFDRANHTGAQAIGAVTDLQAALDGKAERAPGVNAQTGTSYTLTLADGGSLVTMSNAAANTLAIPASGDVSFPVGTIISVVQLGAGVTTIEADTGVTLNGISGGSGGIGSRYQAAALLKIATDTWLASGDFGDAAVTAVARTLLAQSTQALMRTTGLGLSADGSALVSASNYAAMRALLDFAQADIDDLATTATPQFAALNIGHASDTTLGRSAAGIVNVEGHDLALAEPGINAQAGTSYTLVLADKGRIVTMNNAAANALTIPANSAVAFPLGTIINVIQIGAGETGIEGATGVTSTASLLEAVQSAIAGRAWR